MGDVNTIHVPTTSHGYDVMVGQGSIDELGNVTRTTAGGTRAVVVSDSNVGPLYGEKAAARLMEAGYETTRVGFAAGEAHKTLATLGDILEAIASAGLTRDDVVVAVGGGVTGDMAGLAAALYLRGISVVQVPTSLLAMVDSSVGGKTAVDIAAGKNLVGAFWQPSAVIVDVDCLSTLTTELFTDSCGEVIKHAVLADQALFDELRTRPLNDGGRTGTELARVVARNIEIKRDVVAADEQEHGLRQTLNLGHTIGHAIEAASDFTLGHGACVAAGLCCVTRGAARLGWIDAEVATDIIACVSAHGLPTGTAVPHETLIGFATHDKKRHANSINVIVPTAIGSVDIRCLAMDEFSALVQAGCGVEQGV